MNFYWMQARLETQRILQLSADIHFCFIIHYSPITYGTSFVTEYCVLQIIFKIVRLPSSGESCTHRLTNFDGLVVICFPKRRAMDFQCSAGNLPLF